MYFQPFDLVHPFLHELLHWQPPVLPDPSSAAYASLQTPLHAYPPPVPSLPPLHDRLLHVRLDPHQGPEPPAPAILCKITLTHCYSIRPSGLRSVSLCCSCCVYVSASFYGWCAAGYTEGLSKGEGV